MDDDDLAARSAESDIATMREAENSSHEHTSSNQVPQSSEAGHEETTLPAADTIVFHHVEDIRDLSGYPAWSTAASRLPSRSGSPSVNLRTSEFTQFLAASAIDNAQEVPFNPAQIPHNLLPLQAEARSSRQVPIEEIVSHIEEQKMPSTDFESSEAKLPESAYEHQNLAEDDESEVEKRAPILRDVLINNIPAAEELSVVDSEEATMIVHDIQVDPAHASEGGEFGMQDDTAQQLDLSDLLTQSFTATANSDAAETLNSGTPSSQDVIYQPNTAHVDLFAEQSMTEDFEFESILQGEREIHPDAAAVSAAAESADVIDDYDIDSELDAEFAAMAATFVHKPADKPQANMLDAELAALEASLEHDRDDRSANLLPTSNLGTPNKRQTQEPMKTKKSHFVSPYVPATVEAPSPRTQETLFTPAQVPRDSIKAVAGNSLDNRPIPRLPQTTMPDGQSRPSNASSYVSGRSAYIDPYALPDNLPKTIRARPQAQFLRPATSVPNLKAVGIMQPPMGQRHASAMNVPQSNTYGKPPPTRGQPRHGVLPAQSSNSTLQSGLPVSYQQAQSISSTPFQQPSPYHQAQSVSSASLQPVLPSNANLGPYPANQPFATPPPHIVAATGTYSAPGANRSYTPKDPTSYGPVISHEDVPGKPRITEFSSQPNSTYRIGSHSSNQSLVQPLGRQNSLPTPRGQSPLREAMINSVDAVMRGDSSYESTGQFLEMLPDKHHRRESMTSTRSYGSEVRTDSALEDYLNQQRQDEHRMFDDSYSVAENDIHEAQSTQKVRITGASNQSIPATSERPQSQPGALPIRQGAARNTYPARSSFDEKNLRSGLMMSRTSSRTGEDRYANTEPAQSPRQSHVLPEPQRPNTRFAKRPVLSSRATSSSLAYPAFERATSPSLSTSNFFTAERQNSQIDPSTPHPIARFGFGGKLLTMVPRTIPRFSAEGAMVNQLAGPGSIVIRPVQELSNDEVLGNFPGPLLHGKLAPKQKKADLQLWLAQRVPPGNAQVQDDKTILYRLLMLHLEFNGLLERSNIIKKDLIMS